jgi:hypothetical protein
MSLFDDMKTANTVGKLVKKHLSDIQAAIDDGVPLKDIHARMVEKLGITDNLGTFRSALARARAAEKKKQEKGKTETKAADVGIVSRATVPVVEPKHIDPMTETADAKINRALRESDQRNESRTAQLAREFRESQGKT